MAKTDLTAARLREVLHYDPELGWFMWLVKSSSRSLSGSVAGCLHKRTGYIRIGIDGNQYRAHRLAVLWMTGTWPDNEVDHKDTVKVNNNWFNLRDATPSMNCQNQRRAHRRNATGLLGVSKIGNKFRATIRVDGRNVYLGHHDSPEVAHAIHIAGRRKHYPGNTL